MKKKILGFFALLTVSAAHASYDLIDDANSIVKPCLSIKLQQDSDRCFVETGLSEFRSYLNKAYALLETTKQQKVKNSIEEKSKALKIRLIESNIRSIIQSNTECQADQTSTLSPTASQAYCRVLTSIEGKLSLN